MANARPRGSYYNEIDAYAAQWLRNLIAAGHIAAGDVDERSIADVRPDDLRGYAQCHFFAGIGGWSYALRCADWPDDRAVWTGSCPCQPLSSAGQRKGHADQRHLWPAFHDLIAECRPAVIFGEQVASADGREWFSGVRADLEAVGYACGAADLPAAGVGAPHVRSRLFWVADSDRQRPISDRDAGYIGEAERGQAPVNFSEFHHSSSWGEAGRILCDDGKTRLIESGTFPLAHGIPVRALKLRAFGNAIVPQVAAEFIGAFVESRQ